MSSLTCRTQSVWLLNARSFERHWQTHLPNAKADDNSLLIQAQVQYQRGTEGSTVEKPAETQASIPLASHLVRAPDQEDMSLNPLRE